MGLHWQSDNPALFEEGVLECVDDCVADQAAAFGFVQDAVEQVERDGRGWVRFEAEWQLEGGSGVEFARVDDCWATQNGR